MHLNELFDPDVGNFQSLDNDESVYTTKDVRKTRLTLGQLNRLRLMNDQRNFEFQKRMSQIKKIYGAAPESGMGI